MRKLLNIMSLIALLSAFILLALFSYWELYPYKTLTFKDPALEVLSPNKTVKQGGILELRSDYCKWIDIPLTLSRTFNNDLIFAAPSIITNRELGCHVITIAVSIPRELPPGVYFIENTYTFAVNPIRNITIKHATEKFTVIE